MQQTEYCCPVEFLCLHAHKLSKCYNLILGVTMVKGKTKCDNVVKCVLNVYCQIKVIPPKLLEVIMKIRIKCSA